MIAVPDKLPFVHWQKKRSVPLSEGWLAESIEHSASTAGYSEWQWTQDITKAITFYLQKEFSGNLITPHQLTHIMRTSISTIGYPEVAQNATLIAPRVSIYLPDIAHHSQYEIIFFQKLRERLEEAFHVVVKGVKLEDIKTCVKIITKNQSWRKNCQILNDEIVMFTRNHINQRHNPNLELMIT